MAGARMRERGAQQLDRERAGRERDRVDVGDRRHPRRIAADRDDAAVGQRGRSEADAGRDGVGGAVDARRHGIDVDDLDEAGGVRARRVGAAEHRDLRVVDGADRGHRGGEPRRQLRPRRQLAGRRRELLEVGDGCAGRVDAADEQHVALEREPGALGAQLGRDAERRELDAARRRTGAARYRGPRRTGRSGRTRRRRRRGCRCRG